MALFDVGFEGKLRFNGVEAPTGEAARDEILRRLQRNSPYTERIWFQASAPGQVAETNQALEKRGDS